MSPNYHKLNLQLSEIELVITLQQIALSLGYTQKRGPAKGQGSISAMVEALAQGQLEIKRKESNETL